MASALRSEPARGASPLASFRDAHRNQTIIVCGCGPSLNDLRDAHRHITIGVNDVGRLFDPTYLVVVNPRSQFAADRFRYVEQSNARALFTQLELGAVRPRVVRFSLGAYGGTEPCGDNTLHYAQNSPYVAVCLAAFMGARRIGLIGVDLTEDHFFGKTGRHSLAGRLQEVDAQYGLLAGSLKQRGVELVNLSSTSRLTSLPRAGIAQFAGASESLHLAADSTPPMQRVFVVNYKFIACGEVFADGLRHAAAQLGYAHADAYWDDPELAQKIARFRPDVVLVVDGRRFTQKWRDRLRAFNVAVWLVNEPYEVDDTERWSRHFDTVFLNDSSTLDRHANAYALPVCFDPAGYCDAGLERTYLSGFIGASSPTRERLLAGLAQRALLGYVVGGPWKSPALRRLCLARSIPARQAAELYQRTTIVVNVFRDCHHFNARGVPAQAMNPRIYEALACGALVVSEPRPELSAVFPEVPTFSSQEALAETVQELAGDPRRLGALLNASRARLTGHDYAARLKKIMDIAMRSKRTNSMMPEVARPSTETAMRLSAAAPQVPPQRPRWRVAGNGRAAADCEVAGTGVDRRPEPIAIARGGGMPLQDFPFAGTPRRNLLYHVWPVRGCTWKWNLDELKRRIDLFNGRRVIAIVCDERSEEAGAVQAHLDGHGCEFVVMHNDGRGESATFGAMLERVASLNPDELTFYGHAKGVKYEPQLPPNVRKWAEAQYRVTLDDWLAVKEQMQRFAMTGVFKMTGRFQNHRNLGDWHYTGTFFWMRNAHVFARRYQDVPQFYGGVEAWPGIMFDRHETGCLLLDNLRDLPYHARFWTSRADPALRQWQATVRHVEIPADLAQPEPFQGHTWPRLEQKPQEFAWWLELLLSHDVHSVLTLGAMHGGVEWHTARVFHERGRRISITAVDGRERLELLQAHADARARFGQSLNLIVRDSTCGEIRSRLAGHYDAVFIDADHGYSACREDFQLARSLTPTLIGLHDIVDSDWHAASHCCVSRLWDEIAGEHATEQMASNVWGGIGVVRLHPRTA